MNKKALLLKQVIEILLAIAIIVIIIIAAKILIATYFGKQKELQAKETLNLIVKTLHSLEEGEYESIMLSAPVGWHIVAFDTQHNKNDKFDKPEKYFGTNLLCICEKNCKICQQINKPLKQADQQANIRIEIMEIWFSNLGTFYNVSKTIPRELINLSEEEKIKFLAYQLSNTPIDVWLKEKGSPLAGIGQCVIDVSTKTKIPKEVILAIAILESGWGKSALAEECKNLFGIKGEGPAGTCKKLTKEYSNGKEIRIKASFAKYDNFCQSVYCFAKLISTSSHYKEAMQYTNDPERMVYAIHGCSGPYAGKPCVYSTDPKWADKVIGLIRQIKREVNVA